MGMAFTAFAFKDHIENGGEAIKLGFFHAQSYKVAQQMVKESVHQPNGSMKQCSLAKQRKSNKYLIDCAETGSDPGNSENPKFPLIDVFHEYGFPKVSELVGPGWKVRRLCTKSFKVTMLVLIKRKRYLKFVTDYCFQPGWHWEPQAPQMPHLDVLDLSVFPAMSRWHTALVRACGGLGVLKEDEIREAAEQVWRDFPS
jgi:hypothetical protein